MVISVTVPVRVYRANCGFPDIDELNRHGDGARYEEVSRELRKYALEKGLHSKITARGKTLQAMRGEDVAVLTVSLRRYLDHFFGRERVTNGRDRKSADLIPHNESRGKFTLWPRRLFDDLRPQGSLISILKALLSFAYTSDMSILDFLDDLMNNKPFDYAQQGTHLKLAMFLDAQLKKKNWIPSFKIFLALPPNQQQIQTLVNVVQAHGATVVSMPEKATHVIYPDQYGTTEACTDAHVIVRIIKRESFKKQPQENEETTNAIAAEECLLHWLFHPDSYDHWVPANEVLGHVYQPKARRQNQQWHVQARFLRDLDRYHEWMNELDYEMPMSFSGFVNTSAEEYDKTHLPSPSLNPIRLFLRVAAKPVRKRLLNRDDNDNKGSGNDRTTPRKIHPPAIDMDKRAVDAIITDGGDDDDDQPLLPASSSQTPSQAPRSDGRVSNNNNNNNNNNICRDVVEKIRVNNQDSEDPLWMPAFSVWFDMRFVHDLEKRAVPEFFDRSSPSKTEGTYKEVRNFMIRTWRKQPAKYLTATSARKRLIGDACPILRVHSFLEHWGLINFECTPFGSAKLAPSSAQAQAAWMPSSLSPSSSAILQPPPNNTSAANEAEAQAIPLLIPPPPLPPPRPLPGAAGIADHIAVRKASHIITDDGRKTLIRSHGVVIKCDHDGNLPSSSKVPAPSSPTSPGVAALQRTRAILSAGWQHQPDHPSSTIASAGYLNGSNNNKTSSSDDGLGAESMVRFPNPHRRRRHDGGRRSSAMIAHVEYHCDSCGIDCSDIRFHCAVRADVDLCAKCYRDGKYAADITAKDFVQMSSLALSSSFHHLRREKLLTESEEIQSGKTTANGGDGGDGAIQNGDVNSIDTREIDEDYEPGKSSLDWSDDETILLLEALEMYADNWDLVAEHVGSKTKAQCVMHMMRLPIEDSFLKGVAQHWWSKHPEQNNDLPSPFDLVRSCGPREAAIATISAKGAAFKTFSGLPVVYADQIHTVVAFADLLASLGAPEMIAEILDGMGVVRNRDAEFPQLDKCVGSDGSKMLSWGHGRKTDFLRLLRYTHNDSCRYGREQEQGQDNTSKKNNDESDDVHMVDITADADSDADADADADASTGDRRDLAKSMTEDELIQNVISNSLYKSLIKEVKAPHDVALRDYGKVITRASVDLVRDGTISDDTTDQLHIEDSECDIYKEVREDERQGMASPMDFDEDFDDEDDDDCGEGGEDSADGDVEEDNIVEDGKEATNNNNNGDDVPNVDNEKRRRRRKDRVRVEGESSCAVAMTALCCASASASEWAAIEDVEVERLREVIVEMKLEVVRRKLAQLDEVLHGERGLKSQMKRKRELDMCERTIGRKLRRVD